MPGRHHNLKKAKCNKYIISPFVFCEIYYNDYRWLFIAGIGFDANYYIRAYSSVAEHLHGMEGVGVRFSLGPHFRKPQGIESRLASLGDQIVRFLERKNQLAILLLGKENF